MTNTTNSSSQQRVNDKSSEFKISVVLVQFHFPSQDFIFNNQQTHREFSQFPKRWMHSNLNFLSNVEFIPFLKWHDTLHFTARKWNVWTFNGFLSVSTISPELAMMFSAFLEWKMEQTRCLFMELELSSACMLIKYLLKIVEILKHFVMSLTHTIELLYSCFSLGSPTCMGYVIWSVCLWNSIL